jgi:N,N'-diacetyllegionaminate synthase
MKEEVIIIAEAGVNHNGNLNNAFKLIEIAANAGADYVKFQTFRTENLVHKDAPKAGYQVENTHSNEAQFSMLKKLEIPMDWYEKLLKHCDEHKIGFLSTGFDEESIDFLVNLGCEYLKIPSGEITNLPYLKHIGSQGKKVILSTGMADLDEVESAIDALLNAGTSKSEITVLHCNTQYPTLMNDVNLLAMNSMSKAFKVNIGYSDHTLGTEVSVAAVALGARVIEKHFTIDKSMEGPDHAASLSPNELMKLVREIRNIELALKGSGVKVPSKSESLNKIAARKSIHLSVNLKKGSILNESDLVMLRPGDGISPFQLDQVVGKELRVDLERGSKLDWKFLR